MIIDVKKSLTYNEFGNEEMYVEKEIEKIKSNYSKEAGSGVNNSICETCDGKLCNSCHTMYIVRIYGKPFWNSILHMAEYPKKETRVFFDEHSARSYYDSI